MTPKKNKKIKKEGPSVLALVRLEPIKKLSSV
jgi:hypothetical protein